MSLKGRASADRPSDLSEGVETPEEARRRLSEEVAKTKADKVALAANNPKELRAQLREGQDKFLFCLSEQVRMNKEEISPMKRDLQKAFASAPTEQQYVMDVIEGLTGRIPKYGEEINMRYLRASTPMFAGEKTSVYSVDFRTVGNDLEHLKELIAKLDAQDPNAPVYPPEIADDLMAIRDALIDYSKQDRAAAEKIEFKEATSGEHYTDQVVGKFGKISVFLIAAGAAALTGIMALSQRKMSVTPLFYAAVAGLVASPGLRSAIFGGKHEKALAEVDKSMNSTVFKGIAKEYKVGGPEWRKGVQDVIDGKPYVNSFLQKWSEGKATEDDIEDFAERFSDNPKVQDSISDMIHDGKFDAFLKSLHGPKTEDAKVVLTDYLSTRGIRDYYKDKDIVDKAGKVEEAIA